MTFFLVVNLVYDSYQMTNLINHTTQNRSILLLYDMLHFSKAQSVKRSLLIDAGTDSALRLLNLYCCHSLLSSEYFFHRNTTVLSYSSGVAHFAQSQYRSLNQVVRIGRSFGLGKHVLYTNTFKHGTHCTTGNNTSTLRSGQDEDICATELGSLAVRNRTLDNGNLDQILLGSFHALGDSSSNLASLSKTATDYAFTVTNYDNSCKSESTATFSYFNYTIDSNESIF